MNFSLFLSYEIHKIFNFVLKFKVTKIQTRPRFLAGRPVVFWILKSNIVLFSSCRIHKLGCPPAQLGNNNTHKNPAQPWILSSILQITVNFQSFWAREVIQMLPERWAKMSI